MGLLEYLNILAGLSATVAKDRTNHIPLVEHFVVVLLNSSLDPLHDRLVLQFDDGTLDGITIMGILGFPVEVNVRVLKTDDLHRLLFE